MDTRWPIALLLTAVMALAGCAGGGGTLGSDASLTFDGSGSGSHSEEADCNDEGTLTGDGNVSDGRLEVTVSDGGGDEVFSQSFEGEFTLEPKQMNGASGSWEITADRSGDDLAGDEFQGKYTFRLDC